MKRPRRLAPVLALALAAATACGSRTAYVDTEPVAPTVPTQADYYGTYDLYLATSPDQPLIAKWGPGGFVVTQTVGGARVIDAVVAIAPEEPSRGTMRIWDENTSDPLCAAEGVYDYTDDGREVVLALVTDPCVNRAASADGSRLVRPPDPAS